MHLNAINQVQGPKPWALTFSFGRALQSSTLKAWAGKPENLAHAQEVFTKRARACGQAALGKYTGDAADEASKATLFVRNYTY